jgi:hypothetical protein
MIVLGYGAMRGRIAGWSGRGRAPFDRPVFLFTYCVFIVFASAIQHDSPN